ncbi:MAG: DUF1573 domain-containing protein [Carboxylicivirga sp.]|jgi:hypothetical protein|nr:DUF1573 domain-containing protein [Carboxylicivirga sp.]
MESKTRFKIFTILTATLLITAASLNYMHGYQTKSEKALNQAANKQITSAKIMTAGIQKNKSSVVRQSKLSKDYDITWKFKEYDFGTITQGTPADSIQFSFTVNSGQAMMTGTVSHCGCTTGHWKPQRLNPGQTGYIVLKYDTKRLGYFRKEFDITFNRSGKKEKLIITGKVKGKENQTK